ncbi:hypothetical protein K461DRAFT_280620 [Myriangium duriaei CBS 260.36]|uniref:Zn(2)-C6 fungal-type domain-containing protein n=1 Tax=Myriangium duriaei CBS 260.36 TaxID=1168546 RepID=A0A9P4MF33_9PEZI|nr:hypothetical protein K461DRAFT_280620 [Myriangium duriaei CBS 260.36]
MSPLADSDKMSAAQGDPESSKAAAPPTRQPLIRSCLPCHQRRVKCDKGRPCAVCVKAKTDCVYPPEGKLKRRRRKQQHDAELIGRIRELETAVDRLGNTAVPRGAGGPNRIEGEEVASLAEEFANLGPIKHKGAALVVKEDNAQFISGPFWVKITEELAELKDAILRPDSDESEDEEDPNEPSIHQSFIFGGSPSAGCTPLSQLRPSPEHIFAIWETYKENVDTIIKVLHIPSATLLMMNAVRDPDGMSKPAEALYFAICFGAVLSMTDNQCRTLLGDERDALIKRFRLGTEQALARAKFMSNSSLTSLQAFSLYVSFIRTLDESKAVWTLGSLAVSLAISLGLYRDGTVFNLKPFDTEMRRRLWWHIWSLNRMFDEDHGICSSAMIDSINDTQLPLNVNDEDLDPNMKEFPPAREGFTAIFPAKIRYELAIRFLKILRNKDRYIKNPQDRDATVEEYRSLIHENYMRHCDTRVPIQLLVHNLCRLMIIKLWLFFSLPGTLSAATVDSDTPVAEKERVFETACEAVEIWIAVIGHPEAARWSWFAAAWMQWQLICWIMIEIPKRGLDPTSYRAWAGIKKAWAIKHIRPSKSATSVLWKAVGCLWHKAKDHKHTLERQERERQAQASQYNSIPLGSRPIPVTLTSQAMMTQHPVQQVLTGDYWQLPQITAPEAVNAYSPSNESPGNSSGPSPPGAGQEIDWEKIGEINPCTPGWNNWAPSLGSWDNMLVDFPDPETLPGHQEYTMSPEDMLSHGLPVPPAQGFTGFGNGHAW